MKVKDDPNSEKCFKSYMYKDVYNKAKLLKIKNYLSFWSEKMVAMEVSHKNGRSVTYDIFKKLPK